MRNKIPNWLIVGVILSVICFGVIGAELINRWRITPKEPLSEAELVESYAPATYGLPEYIGGYRVLAVFSDKNWPCFRDDGLGVTLANSGTVSLQELMAQLPRYGIGQNMIVFVDPLISPIEEQRELARIYLKSKDMVCDNYIGPASPP
jgi:hypothetical protein